MFFSEYAFSEHEAICNLATALRINKKDPDTDCAALSQAVSIVRTFVPTEAMRNSAYIYAAFVTRYLRLYGESGNDKVASIGEMLKECRGVFGQSGEELCEYFLTKFITDRPPSLEEEFGRLNTLNAESLLITKSSAKAAQQFYRKQHTSVGASHDVRATGTISVKVPCPGTIDGKNCGEPKRCDQNTKRYRCKKCGFDAPFQDGKIILP